MLSAAVPVIANHLAGMPYSQPQMLYWYGFLKLCLFMFAAFVVAAFHGAFGMRQELSRIENLLTTIAKPAPTIDTSSASAESSRVSPGNRKAG
jgi:type II secretory pathway component PulM